MNDGVDIGGVDGVFHVEGNEELGVKFCVRYDLHLDSDRVKGEHWYKGTPSSGRPSLSETFTIQIFTLLVAEGPFITSPFEVDSVG